MTDHLERRRHLPALDELRGEFLRVARSESRSPTRRRVPPIAAVLVGAFLLVAGGVAGVIAASSGEGTVEPAATESVVSRGGGSSSGDRAAGPVGFAAYEPTFGSLSELTTKSNLVVVGTVEDVSLGKVVIPDPEDPTRSLDVTLNIEDVFKGSVSADSVTVGTFETAFIGPPGGPVTDWRRPGQRVVGFLESDRIEPIEPSVYQPVTYVQAFYMVDGNALRAADQGPPGGLNERIEAMSLPELGQAVKSNSAGK